MSRGPWAWWVRHCTRSVDHRPLELVRILVCLAVVLDLLRAAQLGLVPHLFRLFGDGGIGVRPDPAFLLDPLLGAAAGPVLYGTTLVCMVLGMLGVGTRPVLLLGVLAYAQLGHMAPFGDRAIDRVLRATLLVVIAGGGPGRWTLPAALGWVRGGAPQVPAWTGQLIRWMLVMMYSSAGIGKLIEQPHWLGNSGLSVIYRVLSDPLAGSLDPVSALPWQPLFFLLGWATIALELGAVLMLTRIRPIWALAGLGMHLGIALSMNLGMFSWGMLALYPLMFDVHLPRALDRFGPPAVRADAWRPSPRQTRPAARPAPP